MFKSIVSSVAFAACALAAMAAHAADVNKADQAELEAVKGVGPSLSGRILDERKKGSFKDWNDLITRVKGLGTGNAGRFSDGGLTVGGQAYASAAGAVAKPMKTSAKSPPAAAAVKP